MLFSVNLNRLLFKSVAVLAVPFLFASCSDFLKEASQDEIRPQSVSDYRELITGEIYSKLNNTDNLHTYLDIMTDDCEELAKKARFGSDTRKDGYGYFTWQKAPEVPLEGSLKKDIAWGFYYHQILICNMILYDIDEMVGSANERAVVKAEAYMNRAYAYFMLVNLYGEPYNPKTAKEAKGVPINDLVGSEDKQFKRESVQTIYDLIVENAKKGIEQFDIADNETIYRWNLNASKVFLSRVLVYMQNWDEAIKYAFEVIAARPVIWNLNDRVAEGSNSVYYFNSRNPEILFSYGSYYVKYFTTGAKGAYPVSYDLRTKFKSGDLRCSTSDGAYIRRLGSFFGGGKRYCPYKSEDSQITNVHGYSFRNVEAYLLRAEALSHTSNYMEALKDVEAIRKNRFKPLNYSPLSVSTQDEVIEAVRTERRLEMCFEQLRWFDLRRWNQPRIVHTYTKELGNAESRVYFVLDKDDSAYTLPIPTDVMERDTDMWNVTRKDREELSSNPDIV